MGDLEDAQDAANQGNTEKEELLNRNDNRYTPIKGACPVVVAADKNGRKYDDVPTKGETEILLPPQETYTLGWDHKDHPEKAILPVKEDQEQPPPDRFMIVYIILLLHGVATLMPWNMFITANAYFVDYKLATSSGSEYQKNFMSYLGITSQIPNVVLNGLNVFCQCGGGRTGTRIIWSIIVCVVMFIVTVALAMMDSSGWPGTFFAITMASVVVINMANGVYQNCVYGVAACLPMKYTNAVVLGSNISGTFTSILNIIAIASTPNPRTSAIYYFLGAILILLVAFDTFFLLPHMKFYRYYKKQAKAKHVENVGVEGVSSRPPYLMIFKKIWVQLLGVFFVFFVTLTVFPAIQVDIEMSDPNFFIPEKYFTPVTCFLFFNSFAMLGNITTEFITKPGPKWVWLPILIRGIFFIPFFIMCNYRPFIRGLPVWIKNDYVYCVGGIVMAFTSGYFSSLTMMYAPRLVEPQHQGTAGMMAAFFLILGIFGGVNFSLPVAIFVEKAGLRSAGFGMATNSTGLN